MRVHHQRDEPPYDSPRTTNRTSRCNATRFHNPRLSPRDPGYPSVRQVFWLTPLRRTFPRLRGLSGFQRCNSMRFTATGLRRTSTCFPLQCSSFTNSHNPTDREVNFFLQIFSSFGKIFAPHATRYIPFSWARPCLRHIILNAPPYVPSQINRHSIPQHLLLRRSAPLKAKVCGKRLD